MVQNVVGRAFIFHAKLATFSRTAFLKPTHFFLPLSVNDRQLFANEQQLVRNRTYKHLIFQPKYFIVKSLQKWREVCSPFPILATCTFTS
jgi:hypothetical protein